MLVIYGVDPDRWSYFETLSIFNEEFKYDGVLNMWWKPKRGRMGIDLRPLLVTDRDALQLSEYVEKKKEEWRFTLNNGYYN